MTGAGHGGTGPPARAAVTVEHVPLDPATAVIWFDAVLRHTRALAAVRDARGALRWTNTAFRRALGHPSDQLLGRTWADLQPPDLASRHQDVDHRVLLGTTPVHWRLPVQVDGVTRPAAGMTFPVDLPDGRRGAGTTFALDGPGAPGDAVPTAPVPAAAAVAPPALSAREVAVLEGIAEGRSSQQLSRLLGMSQKGVDYHVKKLGDLLGAPNRTALVARAYAVGVLAPDTWPPRAVTAPAPWNDRSSA